MESEFRRVVEHIFNNWTALFLAVNYSDVSDSKKIVQQFIDYVVQYCVLNSDVDVDGIQEVLDDIMDQELDTVCEDNSTKEIAIILHNFIAMINKGDMVKFEEEYQKLPVNSLILQSSEATKVKKSPEAQEIRNNIDSCEDVPMEDSEWTEVKSKRRH